MTTLKEKREKRTNKIIKEVSKNKLTYREIGEKFGITKQRINFIAMSNGINRRLSNYNEKKRISDEITKDIRNNLTIKKICDKHNIVDNHELMRVYKYYGKQIKTPIQIYKSKRNDKISEYFKSGKTAKEIILLNDSILTNNVKINHINGVYQINKKNNFKRYTEIGNRHNGGVFEKKIILKKIANMYDRKKNKLSFVKIANFLNENGYRTVTNKLFTYEMVRLKYLQYKNI